MPLSASIMVVEQISGVGLCPKIPLQEKSTKKMVDTLILGRVPKQACNSKSISTLRWRSGLTNNTIIMIMPLGASIMVVEQISSKSLCPKIPLQEKVWKMADALILGRVSKQACNSKSMST